MTTRTILILAVSALVAFAASFALSRAQSHPMSHSAGEGAIPVKPTTAPLLADYRYRNAIIADLEADVRRHPDQLDSRMLAGQYLQRFREAPDVGDLLRAVARAQLGLHYQPRYNAAAESTLASAFAALHRFRTAKRYADDVVKIIPWSADARATEASLDVELGDYCQAREILRKVPARADPAWKTAAARYAELTGSLAAARHLIARSIADVDSNTYAPAENRAWYHWRAGELAFEAGEPQAAEAHYKEALSIFPNYWHATNGLAKVYWSEKRWHEALNEAIASSNVYPLPETLGYEYDAQLALHDVAGAARTAKLVDAIEQIGNAQGINDRMIATFYSDHGFAPGRAILIARHDLSTRDDIYSEDTLGWALAMDARWKDALPHAERAASLGTPDARLQFHTALVELHNGKTTRGTRRLRYALSLNSHFSPIFADQARKIAAKIEHGAAAARSSDMGLGGLVPDTSSLRRKSASSRQKAKDKRGLIFTFF